MEMYTTHHVGGHTPWVATAEVSRHTQTNPRHPLPAPPPPVIRPISSTPPPPRLLLPTPSTHPSTTTNPTTGNRFGASPGATFSPGASLQQASANELTTAAKAPQGPRTCALPTAASSSSARIACYKCQGWGHFAAQCLSSRHTTRPARALLVEIQDDEQLSPPRPDDVPAEIYEADPELAQAFQGSPSVIGCIIKEKMTITIAEYSQAIAAPLGTMLSGPSSGGEEEARPITEDPLRSSIFSTFTKIGPIVVKILVDSGSVVNAVAAASVHALGLHPRLHPRPYKAMWINEASLAVTKRCVVPLKVAGYQEDVWCDILPMGVGSVLLG